jgi:hypothetical protein
VCVCVHINNAAIEKESLELLISMYIGMMMMMARVDIRSRQEREKKKKRVREEHFFIAPCCRGVKKQKKNTGMEGRELAGWAPAVVSPLDSI